jgi:hypothetical protein
MVFKRPCRPSRRESAARLLTDSARDKSRYTAYWSIHAFNHKVAADLRAYGTMKPMEYNIHPVSKAGYHRAEVGSQTTDIKPPHEVPQLHVGLKW